MTATNFRELLDPIEHFKASDGMWSTRILDADDLLARPVPWVDCPTCDALGWVGGPTPDGADPCDTCPACTGSGHATVAQLLAWGSSVAQDPSDADEIVEDWRNRTLDATPGRVL